MSFLAIAGVVIPSCGNAPYSDRNCQIRLPFDMHLGGSTPFSGTTPTTGPRLPAVSNPVPCGVHHTRQHLLRTLYKVTVGPTRGLFDCLMSTLSLPLVRRSGSSFAPVMSVNTLN